MTSPTHLDADRSSEAQLEVWQPIETAPTDGRSLIMICGSAYSPEATVGWRNGDGWDHYSRPDEKWHGGVGRWFPTHWKPLPPPPAEHSASDGSHDEPGRAAEDTLKSLAMPRDENDKSNEGVREKIAEPTDARDTMGVGSREFYVLESAMWQGIAKRAIRSLKALQEGASLALAIAPDGPVADFLAAIHREAVRGQLASDETTNEAAGLQDPHSPPLRSEGEG